MSLLLGRQVQGYRLILSLAHTATHDLYLGEALQTAAPRETAQTTLPIAYVVLKHWTAHPLVADAQQERFMQEAERVQQIRHPHLLPVCAFGIEEDYPYLISDYAPKKSLGYLLQLHHPLLVPQTSAVNVLSQIGLALHTLHQHGMVHGNLKPENILFTSDGEAQLTDLLLPSLSEKRAATASHEGVGYLAPEAVLGPQTPKADQYGLAALAYELFTGGPPFTKASLQTSEGWLLDASLRTETLITPRERNPLLPISIEQTLLKALATQPAHRYGDVLEMVMALNVPEAQTQATWAPITSTTVLLDPSLQKTIVTPPSASPPVTPPPPVPPHAETQRTSEPTRSQAHTQTSAPPPDAPRESVIDIKADPPRHSRPWWQRLRSYRLALIGLTALILLASVSTLLFDLMRMPPVSATSVPNHRHPSGTPTEPNPLTGLIPFGTWLGLGAPAATPTPTHPVSATPTPPPTSATGSTNPPAVVAPPPPAAPTVTVTPVVQPTTATPPGLTPTATLPPPPIPTSTPTAPPTPKPTKSKPTPTPTATATATPITCLASIASPCPPTIPAGLTRVSFEDGTIDGWSGQAQVVTLQNSTQFAADGTHSLHVTLTHIAGTDYPYMVVDSSHLSPLPQKGQTISLWVYIPDLTVQLQGKILVMDNQMNWYSPTTMSKLTSGHWSQLTFTVPPNSGPTLQMGIQFNSLTAGFLTSDIYVDAIGWA